MLKIPASPRIERLREIYYNGPVFQECLPYYHIRRQRLNYMKAYLSNSKPSVLLRRSYAEGEMLKQMNPIIEKEELIVGKFDFYPLTEEEQKECDECEEKMTVAPGGSGMKGHMVPDYPKLLRLGVEGILEEIRTYRSQLDIDTNPQEDLEKDEFYECCEAELEGLLVLQKKYAQHARDMAKKEQDKEIKKNLNEIAKVLDWVPAKPARNFREALQSIHFFHFSLWNGCHFGRVDQFLLPYYTRDIQSGILTKEKAQELIDCFRLIAVSYMHPDTSVNVLVGGRDPQGNLVENELTEMFLVSIENIRTMHKVEFAISSETSDELLRYAIELNLKGFTLPSLLNDDVITEGMMQAGFPEEDARNWANTGCVEITPIGKSGIFVVSPYHNMANMLLEAMKQNVHSIEELFEEFKKVLRREIVLGQRVENRYQLERTRIGREVMRLSCLVDDCIKQGKSIDQGGARYNQIQPNFLGLANVADSFTVLEELVFDSKEYTLEEFCQILEQDFEGYENLRFRILHQIPHYGTNQERADQWVQRVTDAIVECCKGLSTFRGSFLSPGCFSYLEHARHGLKTGATPDGRKAAYPLSSGSSPVQGRETDGPTSAMLSATSWDHRPFLGGVAVNMKFEPNRTDEESLTKFLALLKVFLARGGFEMQINAANSQQLEEARKNPEQYRDLMVRVGGFSANFVQLTPEMQQEIIDRNIHSI